MAKPKDADRPSLFDWWVRRGTFQLTTGTWTSHTWAKRDLPEGIETIDVYVMREGDGRAWISPDGNWNMSPYPVHPPSTFEEVVGFLGRCAVAPPITTVHVDGVTCWTFGIVVDSPWGARWGPWETGTDGDGCGMPYPWKL